MENKLNRLSEPKIKGEKSPDELTIINYLASYIWKDWNSYLAGQNITYENFYTFLWQKFRSQIEEWSKGKISWEELINRIENAVTSPYQEYHFLFEIKPRAIFGLPDDDVVILPEGIKKIKSHGVTLRGKIVCHGTQSIYRKDEDKLILEKEIENERKIRIKVEDNFLHVFVIATSEKEALSKTNRIIEDLIHLLTLTYGLGEKPEFMYYPSILFRFKIVLAEDQYGREVGVPSRLLSMNVIKYNLKYLKEVLTQSLDECRLLEDQKLRKSLEYFYHALFLEHIRLELLDMASPIEAEQQMYLLSDIILNLHKSVSVIVGDPSKDRDYQKRYKKYGIDYEFWKEKIEKLREIRNSWDIAHYELTREKLEELGREIFEAFATTRLVILKYKEFLKARYK